MARKLEGQNAGKPLTNHLNDICGLVPFAGGDKPRHYKRRFTELVGAGFIPARDTAGIKSKSRRKIAQIRFQLFLRLPACRLAVRYHISQIAQNNSDRAK